jgi:hypothetical protein
LALTRTAHFLVLLLSCSTDIDGDGSPARQDCDDADAAVFPDAPERCDGLDNDCDGLIDEGPAEATFFLDADGDGFGTGEPVPSDSCAPAAGFSARAGDCDDARADVFPGAPEVCHDDAVNDCEATEPPDCPLSGVIPTRIAIETRPTFDVDFSTIIPYPGEGGQWITLVRSDRGDWVSLGPVLGGRATAGFGESLLKGAAQIARLDNDEDGTPELLIVLRDGTARVLSGPLRKGTIDVAKEGFEVGAGGYLSARASKTWAYLEGPQQVAAERLPLKAREAPFSTMWSAGNLYAVNPIGDSLLAVNWYPNGETLGVSILDADSGLAERGRVGDSELGRIRFALYGPFSGSNASNLVAIYRHQEGTGIVVYEGAPKGNITPEDSAVVWSEVQRASPDFIRDIDQDGHLEVQMSDLSFVRLPTEPGFPPYLQLQDLDSGSLAWLDIDGDGRDEWIGIDTTYQGEGQPLRGFTVLPGNWP